MPTFPLLNISGSCGEILTFPYSITNTSIIDRVSSILYALDANVWEKDIPQAFATGILDALVERIQDPSVALMCGDILAETTFAWSCFNG